MLGFILVLCGCISIIITFFILVVAHLKKWEKIKRYTGVILSIISILMMIYFIYISKSSGNPDAGHEFSQFYFPIMIFSFFIILGIRSAINTFKAKYN